MLTQSHQILKIHKVITAQLKSAAQNEITRAILYQATTASLSNSYKISRHWLTSVNQYKY